MDWLVQVVVAIVVGTVIGGLARLILPGRQRVGIIITILAGAVAAYAGHFIAESLGWVSDEGIDWAKLAIQVALAALAIGAIGGVGASRA